MRCWIMVLFVIIVLLHATTTAHSLELCRNSMAPYARSVNLPFCGLCAPTCCSAEDDSKIASRYKAMNISGTPCGAVVKSILCAECDPYAGTLFSVTSKSPRTIPVLCNSKQSSSPAVNTDYCTYVWDTCKDVPIPDSPFFDNNAAPMKLATQWKSSKDFCSSVGGTSDSDGDSLCFNGNSAAFDLTPIRLEKSLQGSRLNEVGYPIPTGLCLEKIGNGSYLNMAPHPDGSNRVFVNNQAGKIWLATLPPPGSGKPVEIDESSPFLDLSSRVASSGEFGLLGLAFHPNFVKNGRFFVSYNCDSTKVPNCLGTCACKKDYGCNLSEVIPDTANTKPCQFQSVVAEYYASSSAKTANPNEVRRIFTLGLPYSNQHGGQIQFNPVDGYLYFTLGCVGVGDPWNFAQKKRTVLGKILRLDVDKFPSPSEISARGLWGNYSIPSDNPVATDPEFSPEVWAYGLRNSWRCSFDSKKPNYLLCGDVGEDNTFEEINLITKAGNYGWRVYAGFNLYVPTYAPGGSTPPNSINPIFPVMGYGDHDVNGGQGFASVTAGYVYRSETDKCLYGWYIFADLFATSIFKGIESPPGSGKFKQSLIDFSCSKKSPLPCTPLSGKTIPALGFILSFGVDNKNDLYLLTSTGVYRVTDPELCGYKCSE